MPKILKSVQSDGGFSVSDETIIDPTRNIIDANSVKVLDISNSRTFKKEFIIHGSLNNANVSLEMTPTHSVSFNRIVFVSGFMVGTWTGYPIAVYTANANSTLVECTLADHGLTTGDVISVEFAAPYLSSNGNFTVTVVDDDEFTFNTSSPLNVNSPVLAQSAEITSYIETWEIAVKIESAVISDSVNKYEARPFKAAKGTVMMVVDPMTGQKAKFNSKNTIIEVFKKENVVDGKVFYKNSDRLDSNNILKFY